MKKALLFSLLLSFFISCGAQKIEQLPVYKINAYVGQSFGDVTILNPSGSKFEFETSSDPSLIQDKEYTFWFTINNCQQCRIISVTILEKELTTSQVQRDQEAAGKRMKHRNVTPFKQ